MKRKTWLWALVLMAVASCDALFGRLTTLNRDNCVASPGICPEGQTCDQTLEVCGPNLAITECTTSKDCTRDDRPICSPMRQCVACTPSMNTSTECTMARRGKYCISGRCGTCRIDKECLPNYNCSPETYTCGQCDSNVYCVNQHLGGICLDDRTCAPSDKVIYVDNHMGCTHGPGTQDEQPFCEIDEAIVYANMTNRPFILLKNSQVAYRIVTVPPTLTQDLYIFGSWADPSNAQKERNQDTETATVNGFRIQGGSRITIDGLRIIDTVYCQSKDVKLTIKRSYIESPSDYGLSVIDPGCDELEIDRTQITKTGLVGIYIQKDMLHVYRIKNSLFNNNKGRAAQLSAKAPMISYFAFNNVYKNSLDMQIDSKSGIISCLTNMPIKDRIINSIVFANQSNSAKTQISLDCDLSGVVVGVADASTDPGVIKLDPDLDPITLKLVVNSDTTRADNQKCCINRARPFEFSLLSDFFNDRRPNVDKNGKAENYDIGFHEVQEY